MRNELEEERRYKLKIKVQGGTARDGEMSLCALSGLGVKLFVIRGEAFRDPR